MKMQSLQDLMIDQLSDLYDAEKQLTKALPKMAQAASSQQLKAAFQEHLQQTENHVKRLEEVFQNMGMKPKDHPCKAMQGLVAEGDEMIKQKADPDVKDAGLIAAANRVEHYEIAGYGTVRTYAQILGNKKAADLLQQTLDEEGAADKKLTALAESSINLEAASGSGAGR